MDVGIHLFCFVTLSHLHHKTVSALETELQHYVTVYQTVIDILAHYVTKETTKLHRIELILEHLTKEHESLIIDNLDDPVSMFKLIKMLTSDLYNLEKLTEERTAMQDKLSSSKKYGSSKHLNKAALILTTIQYTYDLNLTLLADGLFNVTFNPDNENYTHNSSRLNEHDCFEIGRYLCREEKYKEAVTWFLEAFRRYGKINRTDGLKTKILEHLAFVYDALNNVEEASFWIKKLLLEAPGHPLQDQFMKIIDEYNTILNEEKNSSNEINTNQETFTMEEIIGICLKVTADLYRKACRGETKIVNDVAKRLKCKYLSGNHPYIKLAPVKLEELYLDPDVYMFHDVISDHEIEHIKVISEPRLQQCDVLVNMTQSNVYRMRLCNATHLKPENLSSEEMSLFIKIYDRVADITGMNTDYSEALHVVKYWVGGYYGHHIDFWQNTEPKLGHQLIGNRMATLLFYLSTPGQGGATVFPHLGLNVYPVKGAALFWRNLFPSGTGDLDTIHGSCPVIHGSKMIMTHWIYNIGQELLMPCKLKKDDIWRENLQLPILSKIMNTPCHEDIKKDMQTCRRHGLSFYYRILDMYTGNGN